jgi:hypothetical protein
MWLVALNIPILFFAIFSPWGNILYIFFKQQTGCGWNQIPSQEFNKKLFLCLAPIFFLEKPGKSLAGDDSKKKKFLKL